MINMFNRLFAMITILFSAGERAANTLNILAGVGEEMARGYADVAAIRRSIDVTAAKAELKLLDPTTKVKAVA